MLSVQLFERTEPPWARSILAEEEGLADPAGSTSATEEAGIGQLGYFS